MKWACNVLHFTHRRFDTSIFEEQSRRRKTQEIDLLPFAPSRLCLKN